MPEGREKTNHVQEIIMKKYSVIAFDLDGTLTNPERGQLSGFEYAFKKHGVAYPSRDWLKKYIGPPIHREWREEYGFTSEKVAEMIETYREYYNIYGWWDNEVYEGIVELLSGLKAAGKKIILATSKPEFIARKILTLFGLDGYFDFIGGAAEDETRHLKEEVLRYSLSSIGDYEPTETVLVGDRKYDAEGANTVGIDSIGVLWGHGSREELEASGFTHIVSTPEELLSGILSGK